METIRLVPRLSVFSYIAGQEANRPQRFYGVFDRSGEELARFLTRAGADGFIREQLLPRMESVAV